MNKSEAKQYQILYVSVFLKCSKTCQTSVQVQKSNMKRFCLQD